MTQGGPGHEPATATAAAVTGRNRPNKLAAEISLFSR